MYAHGFSNPLSAAVVAIKATATQNTTGQAPNVQGGGNSGSTMFPGIAVHDLAGTASVNAGQDAWIAHQGVAGKQWATCGGVAGVNGLGGIAAMCTGSVGVNVRHIGAGGNVPATQAVGLGGGAPMWGDATNVTAGGLGRYANCFGGELGRRATFGAVPPNCQNAYGVKLGFQPMGCISGGVVPGHGGAAQG